MKFVAIFLIILLSAAVIVESQEFNTLKFLFQVFSGDFSFKKKEVPRSVLKNDTSCYLGELKKYPLATNSLSMDINQLF